VRCGECETDPLTPGHFCECCGRRLSLEERTARETPVTDVVDDGALGRRAASAAVCDGCGAPSADGDLCLSCQQAFGSLLGDTRLTGSGDPAEAHAAVLPSAIVAPIETRPPAASSDSVPVHPHVDQVAPTETTSFGSVPDASSGVSFAEVWSSLSTAPEPVETGPLAETMSSGVLSDVPVARSFSEATPPPPAACEPVETRPPVETMSGALSPAVPAARSFADAVLPPLEKTASNREGQTAALPTTPAPDARAEDGRRPKAPRPAVPNKPAAASPPTHGRARGWILAAAMLLIAALIGVPEGVRRLGIQGPAEKVSEAPAQPPAAAPDPPPAETARGTTRAAAEPEAKVARGAASAGPKPSAPVRAPRVARAPAKVVRQPAPSTPLAHNNVPSPEAEVPAPVDEPPPVVPAAAESPRRSAPAAPAGRFFEPTEVDQSPQIVTRVEPHLPPDLQARALNDLVVVRVLVSQSGHPFQVSLLRRSRQGRSLDQAVVEAVTQWTFSPARRRGEAVASWYNIGVPLGGSN
jgi:protein TonB